MSANNFMNLNEKRSAEVISSEIRRNMKEFTDSKSNVPTIQSVKDVLSKQLKQFAQMGLISSEDEGGFKIGEVSQLWSRWSWKKKFKWKLHNSFIYITQSNAIRKEIDDYNDLIFELDMYLNNNPESDIIIPMTKEYPEHLITNPRSIIVSDMQIKLNQGIDFIHINIELDGK